MMQPEPGPLVETVLREIARHLAALAASGQAGSIDIRSLPLSTPDKQALDAILGRGDVVAALDVVGESEIWETSYPGVWWVRHYGKGERIAAERIEITTVPQILISQSDDIAAASARLNEHILSAFGDKELKHV